MTTQRTVAPLLGQQEEPLISPDQTVIGNIGQVTETAGEKKMTAAERTKLAGVAAGATANASDAALRDRSTHTGTQSAATVNETSERNFVSAATKARAEQLAGEKVPGWVDGAQVVVNPAGEIISVNGNTAVAQMPRRLPAWASGTLTVNRAGEIVRHDGPEADARQRALQARIEGRARLSPHLIDVLGNSKDAQMYLDLERRSLSAWSYLVSGCAMLGGRLRVNLNLSVTGGRLDQVLTEANLAQVIASDALFVVIGDATNDIGQLANFPGVRDYWNGGGYPDGWPGVRWAVELLRAAGKIVLLKTMAAPGMDLGVPAVLNGALRWNASVGSYAAEGKAILLDFARTLLDPLQSHATRPGYLFDNGGGDRLIHEANAGGWAEGVLLFEALDPLIPPLDPLPAHAPDCGPLPNPMLADPDGGSLDGVTGEAPAYVRVGASDAGDVTADVSVFDNGYGNAIRVEITATAAGRVLVLHDFPTGIPAGTWRALQRIRIEDASNMLPPWLKLQDHRVGINREANCCTYAQGEPGARLDPVDWARVGDRTLTLITPPMTPDDGPFEAIPDDWVGAFVWTEFRFAGPGQATVIIDRTAVQAA